MKPFRFTIRRLMVAVAVAGILVGAWIEGERRRRIFHKASVEHTLDLLLMTFGDRGPMTAAKIAWHKQMESKYHRAARHPWLPVWPDPPEPE